MSVINEHPDKNVRTLYAGEVASHTESPWLISWRSPRVDLAHHR